MYNCPKLCDAAIVRFALKFDLINANLLELAFKEDEGLAVNFAETGQQLMENCEAAKRFSWFHEDHKITAAVQGSWHGEYDWDGDWGGQFIELELTIERDDPAKFRENPLQVDPDRLLEPAKPLLNWAEQFPREVTSTATFIVPFSQLPAAGFVREAMAVRTSAGGERLSLNGAEWSFRGFPGDRIAWSYHDQNQSLLGSIVRVSQRTIDYPDLLVDDYFIATGRFQRIIIENQGKE